MSSFYYHKPLAKEPKLAVKCDGCKDVMFTDREGQEFPEHFTVDAREAGWIHIKQDNKWFDYCPACKAYMRAKEREKHFGG